MNARKSIPPRKLGVNGVNRRHVAQTRFDKAASGIRKAFVAFVKAMVVGGGS